MCEIERALNIVVELIQGPTEKEQIDVQGDICLDIVEFLTESWPAVILCQNLSPTFSS